MQPASPPADVYSIAGKRVFVAGHRGMVGQGLVRGLRSEDCEVLTVERAELDLRDRHGVAGWLTANRPDCVFVAAAKVGGILANDDHPADYLFDNLEIETALIRGAFEAGVERLVFLGSSCIYPKHAPQPITEDALLTGPLEPTNAAYAIAKIAGIKMCEALRKQHGARYIAVMPTNLYGPGDNFDLASSHVIPALIRKADAARRAKAATMEVWGSGTPRREFLHVDDCAAGAIHAAKVYEGAQHVNLGVGEDLTIRELAETIAAVVGFRGTLAFDATKPDGTPRKLLDVTKMKALGWAPRIGLRDGLAATTDWFRTNHAVTA